MAKSASAVKQSVIMALVRQFANPRGSMGNVVGWVMAHSASNRQRNRWAVSLLDVQPTDQVLEIGFGPGLAIAELSRRVGPAGHVYGVDKSDVMLRHATRRNAAAIRAGQITLVRAPAEDLPPVVDGPFDVILTVNSLGIWPDTIERLEDLRRRLVPGGRLAIVSQPRHPGATRDPSLAAREKADLLRAVGLTPARTECLGLDPPVVCVIAVNQASPAQEGADS
jgi:ubiquinone/menaquinone biosynthesis C-methylase UbiE